ncbi:MAG: AAA family ATPase [Bacteroidetes bacterium]|nr:AAA family ATPase [Bacteroidota bacterium]
MSINDFQSAVEKLDNRYTTKELRRSVRAFHAPVDRTWLGQKSNKSSLTRILALPVLAKALAERWGLTAHDDIVNKVTETLAYDFWEVNGEPLTTEVASELSEWAIRMVLDEPLYFKNLGISNGSAPVPTPTPAPAPAPAPAPSGDATAQLGALIQQIAGSSVNEGRVREIVREAVEGLGVAGITIQLPAPADPIQLDGHHHASFADLLALTNCGNVWLTGPAGSGKTTGASNVAKALGLPFYAMSVGPQTTKTDMFGYTVAGTGEYKPSLLFTAYTQGGVLLLDEADTCHAGVAKQLKIVLGQDFASFDGQMAERHPDFRVIACANTVGQRSTAYVSAQVQDQAFLDEWLILDWGYDEVLEDRLVKAYAAKDSTKEADILRWCDLVRKARKRIAETGETKALASPRATIKGCKLLLSGVNFDTVKRTCLTNVWGSLDLERKLLG